MPVILCLRDYIHSGSNSYPIFIGFLPAQEVLQIAEAPSFSRSTSHEQIAENILRPPIRDWQRPLDEERVNGISELFNNSGEFMPNPVLLCQNGIAQSNIQIRQQQTTEGGVPTNIWEITIPIPEVGESIPLWILDGQHRINGLGTSPQSNNPIPVVLLLEQGRNVYNGPVVAKIFAQVTTSATKLDDLHNEWLTFAFRLQNYSDGASRSTQDRNAMECVSILCRNPNISSTQEVNPFCNQVKFNKENTVRLTSGGFSYTCTELKELISKHYYNSSSTTRNHLSPESLGDQIALSYHALTRVVQAPQDRSVFFGQLGQGHPGQKIMQDAYIVGILSYLLNHSVPNSWEEVLRDLSFHNTIWNFNWIRSLNGKHQSVSKKLAFDVFAKAFRERALPTTSGDLANYLQGNNAYVVFEFSHLTEGDKPARRDKDELRVSRGEVLSRSINPRRHIKIVRKAENIGELIVSDKNSAPGRTVHYKGISRSGEILTTEKHHQPLDLLVMMEHYGGVESSADLTIDWGSHDS